MKKSILIGNLLAAGALIVMYFVSCVEPSIVGKLAFIGLFYPWLLLVNVLFILLWAMTKPSYILVSLIAILVGWGHVDDHMSINKTQKSKENLTIMTFNVRAFISWNKKTGHVPKKDNISALKSYVKENDVDVLYIQEGIGAYKDDLDKALNFRYYSKVPNTRIWLYSKYPLERISFIKINKNINGVLRADVILPTDTLQVLNVHLTSNEIKRSEIDQLKGDKLDDKKTWQVLKASLGSYQRAAEHRVDDYRLIDSLITTSPHPSVVAGDFNEVAMSYFYRQMTNNMDDAFVTAGNGFSATFKELMGTLRIDYIFVDPSLDVTYYNVIKPSFSDHYPVIAHISLASQSIK